jgi:hypothetical protein
VATKAFGSQERTKQDELLVVRVGFACTHSTRRSWIPWAWSFVSARFLTRMVMLSLGSSPRRRFTLTRSIGAAAPAPAPPLHPPPLSPPMAPPAALRATDGRSAALPAPVSKNAAPAAPCAPSANAMLCQSARSGTGAGNFRGIFPGAFRIVIVHVLIFS